MLLMVMLVDGERGIVCCKECMNSTCRGVVMDDLCEKTATFDRTCQRENLPENCIDVASICLRTCTMRGISNGPPDNKEGTYAWSLKFAFVGPASCGILLPLPLGRMFVRLSTCHCTSLVPKSVGVRRVRSLTKVILRAGGKAQSSE